MIKNILSTPFKIAGTILLTVRNMPREFSHWQRRKDLQAPVVFDGEKFPRTRGIDPDRLYSVPIAYKLLFFWIWQAGMGGGDDKDIPEDMRPMKKPRKKSGLELFFEHYKITHIIGTTWEFRLSDNYCYLTQQWLGFWGTKPSS